MKKNLYSLFLVGISFASFNFQAQTHKCAAATNFEKKLIENPSLQLVREQAELETQNWLSTHPNALQTRNIITIPVVVHVIYKTAAQNVSTAQIQSQIDAMNEDFRLLNADSLPDVHPFWQYTADSQIEFCLASRDPNGNATTGITRTSTTVNFFDGNNGAEKYTSMGGKDNWDPTKYLNIWVCNLDPAAGLLGYATFPSDLSNFPDDDGVVINYTAFGIGGTSVSPNTNGRTGTHEVGHWLNLSHIWGDATCGDDLVSDTKVAETSNYGCPSFPFNPNSTCGSDASGEMYMNYMDYVDDACMVMFTLGQANRMRAALNGPRAGLLSSNGCLPIANMEEILSENSFEIYPNPSADNFTVNTKNKESVDIHVYDLVGTEIVSFKNVNQYPHEMSLKNLPNGSYFLKFTNGNSTITKKIVISK